MKSHFGRFLHHTMSHSDPREVSRSNKFANWFNLDYRVKPDNDRKRKDASLKPDDDNIENAGRSMVEMLGVLAIIGVLSVGAIAGYSKAMMKYKLNQHAEAVNMLINNALQIKDKLAYEANTLTAYGDIFKKLNLLPDGIEYISNDYLQDKWFKDNIYIYHNNSNQNNHGAVRFGFLPTSQGAEICRNIVIAAKENAANLWRVVTYIDTDDGSMDDSPQGTLWGDAYCTNSVNCLRNLDLNRINNLCNTCNGTNCMLFIAYK